MLYVSLRCIMNTFKYFLINPIIVSKLMFKDRTFTFFFYERTIHFSYTDESGCVPNVVMAIACLFPGMLHAEIDILKRLY